MPPLLLFFCFFTSLRSEEISVELLSHFLLSLPLLIHTIVVENNAEDECAVSPLSLSPLVCLFVSSGNSLSSHHARAVGGSGHQWVAG